MERGGYVYILTNYKNNVLYTGVTSDIVGRLYEHRTNFHPNSFTAKYNVKKLVFIKSFETITEAISFEKYVKGKSRRFKIDLIERQNPAWTSLQKMVEEW